MARLVAISILIFWGGAATAQDLYASRAPALAPQERYWIVHERYAQPLFPCHGDQPCVMDRSFAAEMLPGTDRVRMRRLFDTIATRARAAGLPSPHPDAPRLCAAGAQPAAPTRIADRMHPAWQPERLRLSDPLEALRGLGGVHVDVTGVSGPPGETGFGERLQAEVLKRFWDAGVRVLGADEVDDVPGRPRMNLYVTHPGAGSDCHWTAFLQVTQTAILSRDLDVKLRVGTWGMSANASAAAEGSDSFDGILAMFDRFVEDWAAAHDPALEAVNAPPYYPGEDDG
ncbi:MAG: hypothetical protein ACU0CO_08410 [Shimia sp.]